ncbi:hypothetical protein ACHAXT_005470 [Thalassiosira profunda]
MEARGDMEMEARGRSDRCASCEYRRRRRRRPGAMASLSTLALAAAAPTSTASFNAASAAALPSAIRTTHRRRSSLTSPTHHRHVQEYDNSCKGGGVLYPGDNLTRGEFLCHGSLRFGIEASGGQFVLGFYSPIETGGNGTDGGNGTLTESMNATAVDAATPTHLAWTAVPTTLFIEATRPFDHLVLSEDGNLLGYDDAGLEIFDSNYDRNQLEGKEDGSYLMIADECKEVDTIGEEGSMCAALMSPAMPGRPYGMVTWGVRVGTEDVVSVIPEQAGPPEDVPSPTPASVGLFDVTSVDPAVSPTVPTLRPTRRTRRPTPAEANPPTLSPSPSNPTESSLFDTALMYEATSIVWGTVWIDADRNGGMDLGEDTVRDFEVKLFSCDAVESRSNQATVESSFTDEQGMYFFKVPSGRTYQVQFEIDEDAYGYSDGEDTDSNMMGWTECAMTTGEGPIQWNAGLYNVSQPVPSELPPDNPSDKAPEAKADPMSSIGGFIYLDVDEDGAMDSKERTAAVGGYTVNDAVISVSLTNCQNNKVLGMQEVAFPGTYSFSNLTEGLYSLGYEMEVTSVSSSDAEEPRPLYTFVNGDESDPTSYKTECGKLGTGENIDSGNVGMIMRSLLLTPGQLDMEDPEKDEATRAAAAEGDGSSDGGGGSSAGVIVGVLVTLSIVAAAIAVLVKRRGGLDQLDLGSSFPFAGKGQKGREDARSVGSSIAREDKSLMGTPSANQSAIGSLIVETGKNVAGLTAGGDSDGSSSSDSDSSSSDEESYPGMDFALKGRSADGGPPFAPYEGTPDSKEEGFEVYDEEQQRDSEYGPVISDMIARYAQGQGQDEAAEGGYQQGGYYASEDGKRTQSHHNSDEASTSGTSASSRSSDPPAASYRDIPAPGGAPQVGWDTHPQAEYDPNQYAPQEYVDGAAYAANYESGQYGEGGQYDGHYDESNQFVPNQYQYESSGGYHPATNQAGAGYDGQISSDDDESSEEANNSGWSSSSSTTNSSAFSGRSGFSSKTSMKAKARRAQSNPRDNRRTGSWKHEAAIPENSTLEYNAYSMAANRDGYSNNGYDYSGNFAPVPGSPGRSVHSAGSGAGSVGSHPSVYTSGTTGSDQSSDPPGASYKNLGNMRFPPPPPPRTSFTPPRRVSPNTRWGSRGRSVPPPPPRAYPSPPPPR